MNLEDRALLNAKANVLKALGHPTRLFMIQELSKGERCVCSFADQIGADFSTISKHLTVLKHAGLVDDEKRGQKVFYHLKVPCVLQFMNCIDAVLKSNAAASARFFR